MRVGLFFLFIGFLQPAFGQPPNYVPCAGTCASASSQFKPAPPSTDFDYGSLTDASKEYPICGKGRIAVSGDGNYTWTNFSSSGYPKTQIELTDATQTYKYVVKDTGTPVYAYPQGARCVCLKEGKSRSISETPANASTVSMQALSSTYSTSPTVARIYPDTFDVISSQTNAADVFYSPVAIAIHPPTSASPPPDGRRGSLYFADKSSCHCPNINEKAEVPTGSDGDLLGARCIPMISPTPARVLTQFQPAVHDPDQIIDRANEVLSGTQVVESISLPDSPANQWSVTPYVRKIWTCAAPYELDVTTNKCKFVASHHTCGAGGSGGEIASPVSNTVSPEPTPGNGATRFNNTINKRLACCMNAFGTSGSPAAVSDPYPKFDCVDSTTSTPTDFNDLWAGKDDDTDGGQLDAIVLADGSGKIVSGFYSTTGQHCDQFSEFAFPPGSKIVGYKVDPVQKSAQQDVVGGTPVATGYEIPLPSGTAYSGSNGIYSHLRRVKRNSPLKVSYPRSAVEYRQCPILVRAAVVTACPAPTEVPNALVTVTENGKRRCAAASSIQIHVRIEQIYEIAGQPTLKSMDTFADGTQAQSLDISKIIASKYGDLCPPPTRRMDGRCSY